ncbi:response regulator [Emcibacter nanhaiensis]|uniref:Response regulator n=1 Tax=Emcibacter nanhaiensis TaxID=1505037 RepID=A0A501PGS4_9PROT|nr:response regulator [Emcibacter nanhaiensis]TPD59405.1 response regulator [Emcibacter nanhaiensis]
MFPRDPDFDDKKVRRVDDAYPGYVIKEVLDILDVGAVTYVRSVEAGIKLFNEKPWDCVFVDCLKQGGEGFRLLEAVRRNPDEDKIRTPVILCTAFTERLNVCRARDLGANEILAKPVSPDQILVKLACALFKQREFIQAPGYVGPCRRRRQTDWSGKEERRAAGAATTEEITEAEVKEVAHGR